MEISLLMIFAFLCVIVILIVVGMSIRVGADRRKRESERDLPPKNFQEQAVRPVIPAIEPMPEPAKTQRPILPTNCPSCGGYIQVEEIKWLDQVTAQCPYCGKAVRGK
jgi:predicted RNA-binding Zn-ribbon protein involved in translation (DUF1610 family)